MIPISGFVKRDDTGSSHHYQKHCDFHTRQSAASELARWAYDILYRLELGEITITGSWALGRHYELEDLSLAGLIGMAEINKRTWWVLTSKGEQVLKVYQDTHQ